MKKIKLLLVGVAGVFVLLGCAFFVTVRSKLDFVEQKAVCSNAETLLVLLPGRYDVPNDLAKQGFLQAVQQRRIHADVVVPNLHIGYYMARTAVQRLHEDIIAPARARGYEQIWLVGISLGGFGSLLYLQHHNVPIAGIMLIAPYLGGNDIREEVARAGGLLEWSDENSAAEAHERKMWSWLRSYAASAPGEATQTPPLYLGYGTDDRFAPINGLLGQALPDDRVTTVEGGHDWQPWRRLWDQFLDRELLARCPR